MIFTLTKTTCSQRGELFAKSDFHESIRLSVKVLCLRNSGEMSATDPSRKWSFRRSLPHLGTACNLRFFACIHTSAFIKKTLRKLDSIRSLLYEQLDSTEASKALFFAELHPSHNAYAETRENCPKNDFLAGAKISAARVTYPESSYTSYTFLSKRSKLVRS